MIWQKNAMVNKVKSINIFSLLKVYFAHANCYTKKEIILISDLNYVKLFKMYIKTYVLWGS